MLQGVQQHLVIALAQGVTQRLRGRGIQRPRIQQCLDGMGHRFVAVGLGDEGGVIGKAVRVEQAQARKVACLAKLLRCCCQQQHPARCPGQLLHQSIFRADAFRTPFQVVRLVHDQQVPFAGHGLRVARWLRQQEFQAAEHQLPGMKRVVLAAAGLDRGAAFFIVEAE